MDSMEIKVGEYVRTENGEIHKVEDMEDLRIHIKTDKIMFRSWVEDYYGCHKEDRFIKGHSENIMDLIEVGDVGEFFMDYYDEDNEDTNIFEIVGKTIDNKKLCVMTSDYQIDFFPVENLKKFLTRKQFEQNCYRLEENNV